jgi:hypothetical protein
MLFDLRGRGRRRAVQGIYLTLAILMGGGLVFFGIGGNTSGGLFDAIGGSNKNTPVSDTLTKHAASLVRQTKAQPQNALLWSDLARTEFQVAGTGDKFDSANGTFTAKGKAQLLKADAAWQKYLALKPKKIDDRTASLMVQAYGPTGLNMAGKAVSAQEAVIDARDPSSGLFANLAALAYAANQTRKADLASKKAVDLASADRKEQVKAQLESIKTQAAQAAIQQATGGGTSTGG